MAAGSTPGLPNPRVDHWSKAIHRSTTVWGMVAWCRINPRVDCWGVSHATASPVCSEVRRAITKKGRQGGREGRQGGGERRQWPGLVWANVLKVEFQIFKFLGQKSIVVFEVPKKIEFQIFRFLGQKSIVFFEVPKKN